MSNETKQEHTRELYSKDNFMLEAVELKSGKVLTGYIVPERHLIRFIECANALQESEHPETFVQRAKITAQKLDHLQDVVIELEKYKTACESINKDNPMAVAEQLGHLIRSYSELLEYAKHSEDYNFYKELLTKIKSK